MYGKLKMGLIFRILLTAIFLTALPAGAKLAEDDANAVNPSIQDSRTAFLEGALQDEGLCLAYCDQRYAAVSGSSDGFFRCQRSCNRQENRRQAMKAVAAAEKTMRRFLSFNTCLDHHPNEPHQMAVIHCTFPSVLNEQAAEQDTDREAAAIAGG